MGSTLKNILFAVIAPLLVGALIWFFFYREYVDLQYSLSEPLPTQFLSEAGTQTVQQLTIVNQGNVPAKDVKIEVEAEINRFDFQKNLATDQVVVSESENKFHAVYDSLAAGAKIKLVFELRANEIVSDDLIVSHSKGLGSEIFSSSSGQISWSSIISLSFIALYIGMLFFEVRSSANNNLKIRIRYERPEEFLSGKKPILLTESQWKELRTDYVREYRFSKYITGSDIESSDIYRFLDSDKPDYFSDSEWSIFQDNLKSQFSEILDFLHAKYVNSAMLEDLLRLSRPNGYSQRDWDSFIVNTSRSVVSFRLNQMLPLPTLIHLESYFVESKPIGIDEQCWARFLDTIKIIAYIKACEECLSDPKPFIKYESLSKRLLSDEDCNRLKVLSYRIQLSLDKRLEFFDVYDAEAFLDREKPDWLSSDDLEKLKKKADFIVAASSNKKEYEELIRRIDLVLSGSDLGVRSEVINENRWKELFDFYSTFKEKSESLKSEKSSLEFESREVGKFKARLLKQLDIIDIVLSNPSSIDKIEDFDNPFSKGNFDNLRKVSQVLSSEV